MCLFVASFAVGPGVCVWLALSELMPNRIRSNGMSIALLINQFVSTSIAAVFLPTVGQYGYATLFFYGAGCSLLYFLTAACCCLNRGKTLEEIEAHFAGKWPRTVSRRAAPAAEHQRAPRSLQKTFRYIVVERVHLEVGLGLFQHAPYGRPRHQAIKVGRQRIVLLGERQHGSSVEQCRRGSTISQRETGAAHPLARFHALSIIL
jgi:hypothetical protein